MSDLRTTIVRLYTSDPFRTVLSVLAAHSSASKHTRPPTQTPPTHPRLLHPPNPHCHNHPRQPQSHATLRRKPTSLSSLRTRNSKISSKPTPRLSPHYSASTPRPSSQIPKTKRDGASLRGEDLEAVGLEEEDEDEDEVGTLEASMTGKRDGRRKRAMRMACGC